MARAWAVLQQGGGFHVNHIHAQGWISGTFIIDHPGDIKGSRKGHLKFGEPPYDVPVKKGSKMKAEHWVEPKRGRLVLFPSYMWHGTENFESAERRLTLSFDLLPE